MSSSWYYWALCRVPSVRGLSLSIPGAPWFNSLLFVVACFILELEMDSGVFFLCCVGNLHGSWMSYLLKYSMLAYYEGFFVLFFFIYLFWDRKMKELSECTKLIWITMRRALEKLNDEELSVSQEMHFRQKLQVLVHH